MDKKTLVAVLVFCIAGFIFFAALAFYVAGSKHDSGVLPEGPSVKYAEVTRSDAAKEDSRVTVVTKPAPASDDVMVAVKDYAPSIRVELRYSGKKNMTGKRLYDYHEAYLRYGTVKKLVKAQKKLEKYSMGIKIWDAYRTPAAQKKLWAVCPNPAYVSDPAKGTSSHTRGSAVDVTLVDMDGTELVMPTEFDNLTKLADRDYSDIDDEFARENAMLLEKTMKSCGFKAYSEEWWHFTDKDSYGVVKDFIPPE